VSALLSPAPGKRIAPGPLPKSFVFPAFDAWFYDDYDRWSFKTAEALGPLLTEGADTRFFLYEKMGKEDRVILPTQEASLYEPLTARLGPAFWPDLLHLHLNPMVLKKLGECALRPTRTDLLYVPIPVGSFGNLSDRLLGPGDAVDFHPVLTGNYPPGIQRTVRRWKNRGEDDAGKKNNGPVSFWTNPISRF